MPGGTEQGGQGSGRAGGGGGWQGWRPGPGRGPRGGGKRRRGGRQRWPGTSRPRGRCPPIAFWRGGSLLLPPVDCCRPVDGDGLDSGDKK